MCSPHCLRTAGLAVLALLCLLALPDPARAERCVEGDCANGIGTYVWDNGNSYRGGWQNDRQHGFGVYEFVTTGEHFEGEFRNGRRNGPGVQAYRSGERYVGDFQNGKRGGLGTFYWPDGTYYVGEFQNDWSHGLGVRYFMDGRVERGRWADDRFITPMSESEYLRAGGVLSLPGGPGGSLPPRGSGKGEGGL
jgi:hypothetical protein